MDSNTPKKPVQIDRLSKSETLARLDEAAALVTTQKELHEKRLKSINDAKATVSAAEDSAVFNVAAAPDLASGYEPVV